MQKQFTILNMVTGNSVEFKDDGTTGFVAKEVDWDCPNISKVSYRVPFQIGETLQGITIGTRKPTIFGYVVANIQSSLGMSWSDYYERQQEVIDDRKMKLNRIININQDVKFIIGEYVLVARPTKPPIYSVKESENNDVLCYFELEFEAFKPLFTKGSKTVELATVEPKFHFPLVLKQTGIVMSILRRQQTVLIENEGDQDVGCIITIKAVGGEVGNPKVYNVRDNEYIEFIGVTLQDGEYIVINTNTEEEDVYMYSKSKDSFVSLIPYLKDGSKFFKIKQGIAYYAYSVRDEYKNNINVSIEFDEGFFNMRGM